MRKNFLFRAGNFILSLVFMFSFAVVPVEAGASGTDVLPAPDSIKISGLNGYVYKTYNAPGADKLVIHIQDAHCNPGVQHNIAGILSELNENHNVDMIGIEGASRWVSTAILNAIPNKELREEINAKLVDDSIIYGSTEFVANQEDFDALLFGVETKDLYHKNILCYGKAAEARDAGLGQVDLIEEGLAGIQSRLLNERLSGYIDKKTLYNNRGISFSDYLEALARTAEDESISLDRICPNIKRAVKSYRLEDDIDFDKVETERTELIDKLSGTLSKDKLEELVSNSLKFRTGKMDAVDYYDYLEKLLSQGDSYADLRKYIDYIGLNEKLDKNALTAERLSLEAAIENVLAKTGEEKTFVALAEYVAIVKHLFNVEVTRDEYTKLTAGKKTFQEILAFIRENTERYGVEFAWDMADSTVWENSYKAAVDFYNAALERENTFIDNLTRQMDTDNAGVAALITGGFHTEKIEETLKAKNISYVVVRPKVAQRTPEGVYDKLMKEAAERISAYTLAPPQDPAAIARGAAEGTGVSPDAAVKGAKEAGADTAGQPTTDGARGAEEGAKKSFQAGIYSNVPREAVTGDVKDIYDRMVSAIEKKAGTGIKVLFTESKGIACIRGNEIRISDPTVRLFALIASRNAGGLDERMLTGFLVNVVLQHELGHKDFPQASEEAIVLKEVGNLKSLEGEIPGIIAKLETLFKGAVSLDNEKPVYIGDAAYSIFLEGVGKQIVNPTEGGDKVSADRLVETQRQQWIGKAIGVLKPVSGDILVIDFAGLGEARIEGKEGRVVMLNDSTVAAYKDRYPLVTASGDVSIVDIASAINDAKIMGDGVVKTKLKDRLVIEGKTQNPDAVIANNTDKVRAAVRRALASPFSDQIVVQQIEVDLINEGNAQEIGLILSALRKANNKIQFIKARGDGTVEVVSAPPAYKAYQTESDRIDLAKAGRVIRIVSSANISRYEKSVSQANTYYITVEQLNGAIPVFAACAAGNENLLREGDISGLPAEFQELFKLLFGDTLTSADIKAYFNQPWLAGLLDRILPRIVPMDYTAIVLTYTLASISA